MNKETRLNWVLKPLVHAAALGPLVWLVWLGMHGQFGPNPAEFINRYTGDWAIRLLLIALAVTPVRGITGLAVVMRFRRMLGLYAFFYALLHVSSYVALDQYFAWAAIWQDILKRNYITVGMLGLVILTALAVTSPKAIPDRTPDLRWDRGSAACLSRHYLDKDADAVARRPGGRSGGLTADVCFYPAVIC